MNPDAERSLLSFSALEKSFAGVRVLDGVSAQLSAGDVVLLEGGNGAGKTTLLNMLGGSLLPDAGELRFFDGARYLVFRHPEPRWRRWLAWPALRPEIVANAGLARVWQDARLPVSLDLIDTLAVAGQHQPGESPLRVLLSGRRVRAHENNLRVQARERLERAGFARRETDRPGQLSLGESRRVAIARAVIAGARVLLLDEPMAGLDEAGRAQLLAELGALMAAGNCALVIVEHASNRAALLPIVNRRWRLAGGRLFESRAGDDLSTPDGRMIDAKEPEQALVSSAHFPRVVELPGGARLEIHCRRDGPGEALLIVERLRIVRGGNRVVAGGGEPLSFVLHEGETALLRAPNGWGKSSLLEAIAGQLPIAGGVIRLGGSLLASAAPESMAGISLPAYRRAGLGLALLRSRDHGFPDLTVAETLALSGIDEIPPLLKPLRGRLGANLSGGERQLLALMCVLLAPGARVRLLDEPLLGLDTNARGTISEYYWRTDGVNLIAVPADPGA